MFSARAEITGLGQLLAKLDGLKRGARNRILRPALAAAARGVVKRAKLNIRATLRRRTGLLARSVSAAVRTGKRAGTVYAVVGPRKGLRQTYNGRPVDPTNYGHFSEFGTVKEPARPWLRPALESSRGEIRAAMAERIRGGLAKLAAKGGG